MVRVRVRVRVRGGGGLCAHRRLDCELRDLLRHEDAQVVLLGELLRQQALAAEGLAREGDLGQRGAHLVRVRVGVRVGVRVRATSAMSS